MVRRGFGDLVEAGKFARIFEDTTENGFDVGAEDETCRDRGGEGVGKFPVEAGANVAKVHQVATREKAPQDVAGPGSLTGAPVLGKGLGQQGDGPVEGFRGCDDGERFEARGAWCAGHGMGTVWTTRRWRPSTAVWFPFRCMNGGRGYGPDAHTEFGTGQCYISKAPGMFQGGRKGQFRS